MGLKYSDYLLEQAGEYSLYPTFHGHKEWRLAQVGTRNQTLFLNVIVVYWRNRMKLHALSTSVNVLDPKYALSFDIYISMLWFM
jgi:hypothetical protein